MFRVVAAKPLAHYRLAIKFSNGVVGEVDLSRLAGQGVFAAWNAPGAFERVQVGAHGEVHWGDNLDLCPDALYLEVTGQKPEDVFPALRESAVHAGD